MSGLLQHYARDQAEQRAGATALVFNDERMTFGELEAASNQLAWLLREQGCKRGDRVCLFLPKGITAIVSMLGVLKADCAYVPIDIASPPARVARIVSSAEPRMLLAAGEATGLLDGLIAGDHLPASMAIGGVEEAKIAGERFQTQFAAHDWAGYPSEPPASRNSGSDIAHLLFTSGSTGTPKGVVITHDNVRAFVAWANRYFDVGPSERLSGHHPLHFDLSTYDIYGALAGGAPHFLVPPALNLLPGKLAAFIRSAELTRWFSVPSTLSYMAKFDVIEQDDFPTLRRLLWCGEVLPTPVLMHWMRRLPHVEFTNLYGPTEATIASSYYTVPQVPQAETDDVPIGTPCDGEELLVLDAELQPVEPGEIGDLYIAGVGLSPGYWRDEEKTRAAFLPDPRPSAAPGERIYRTGDLARVDEDGVVHFLGRADSQIKSRGYRIELGEVEAALNALSGLRECAVVGVPTDGFEGTAIACAFVPGDEQPQAAQLRAALRERLPSYMLPSRWKAFDTLPKNANGKIDRRRLRELFESDDRA